MSDAIRGTGAGSPSSRVRFGRRVSVAVLLLIVGASQAWAVVPEVQDKGGFFKPETIAKANDVLVDIATKYRKDLLIETYPSVPQEKAAAFKDMDEQARHKFFEEWANSRARRRRVEGIYVLITKEPGHVQIEVGRQTLRAAFTEKDRDRLREIFLDAFKKKEFDRGLLEGVQFVEKTLGQNPSGRPAERVK
jgi:uncharacterized membrane protein YgcG